MMEIITTFSNELAGLYKTKPPISKAKMVLITKCAMKAGKFFKHIVHNVEKFIAKCPPHYKVPGLYVIDSIIKQSRHQFGVEKDLYGARFAKNFEATFTHILQCPETDKAKVKKVLNIWLKHGVFSSDVIQPLLRLVDKGEPPPPPPKPGASQEEDPQLLLQSIQEQLAGQPPGAPIDNALMIQIQTLTEKLIQQTLDQSSGSDVLANPDLLKQIQDISNALLQSETDEPADEHKSPESDSSQSSLKKYRSRESWERVRARKGFPPPKDGCVTVCSRTIWIGSLRPTMGDLELLKLFDDYGEVESIHMIHSKGCAFLVMKEREEAHLALKSLRNARLQGVILKMDWAPGKGAKEPRYREFWDVDLGVFHIPYKKMPKNMVALAEGGWIEKQTLTDELKKTYEKQLKKAKTTLQQEQAVGNTLPPVNMSLLQQGLPGVLQTMQPVMNVPHSPAFVSSNDGNAPQSAQRTLTEVLASWAKQQSDLGLVSDMPATTEALAVQGLQAISQQLTQMGHVGLAGLSALGPPMAPPPPLLSNSSAPTPLMAVDTGQAPLLGEHRLPVLRNASGILPIPSTPPSNQLDLNRPPELVPHSHVPIAPRKLIPGSDQVAPMQRDLASDHQSYLDPLQRSAFLQNQFMDHSNRGQRDNRQPGRWNTDDKSGRANRGGQRASRWGPQQNRWSENKGWRQSENVQQDRSFSGNSNKWDRRRNSVESFNKPHARKSRWKSEGMLEGDFEERTKAEDGCHELPFAFGSTKWNNEVADPHTLPMSFESKKWRRYDGTTPSSTASSKWQRDLPSVEHQQENNGVLPISLRGGKYNRKVDKNNPNILPLGANSRMERIQNKNQNATRNFSTEEKLFGMENSPASNLNKLDKADDPHALPMSFSSTKWKKGDENYDFQNSFGSPQWKAKGAVRSGSKDSNCIPAKTTSPTACPENLPPQQFVNSNMNGGTRLTLTGHSESVVSHQFMGVDMKGGPPAPAELSESMGSPQFMNIGMQGGPDLSFQVEHAERREELGAPRVTGSQRKEPLPPGVTATEHCDSYYEGEKALFDNLPDSESDKTASIAATVSSSDHAEVDTMWMHWNDSVRNASLSEMLEEPLSEEEGGEEPPPPGTEEVYYKFPTIMNCDVSLLSEGQCVETLQNGFVSKTNHITEQKNKPFAFNANDDGFITAAPVDVTLKKTNSGNGLKHNLAAGITSGGNTDGAVQQETSDNNERDEETEDISRSNLSKGGSFGIAAFLQQIQGGISVRAQKSKNINQSSGSRHSFQIDKSKSAGSEEVKKASSSQETDENTADDLQDFALTVGVNLTVKPLLSAEKQRKRPFTVEKGPKEPKSYAHLSMEDMGLPLGFASSKVIKDDDSGLPFAFGSTRSRYQDTEMNGSCKTGERASRRSSWDKSEQSNYSKKGSFHSGSDYQLLSDSTDEFVGSEETRKKRRNSEETRKKRRNSEAMWLEQPELDVKRRRYGKHDHDTSPSKESSDYNMKKHREDHSHGIRDTRSGSRGSDISHHSQHTGSSNFKASVIAHQEHDVCEERWRSAKVMHHTVTMDETLPHYGMERVDVTHPYSHDIVDSKLEAAVESPIKQREHLEGILKTMEWDSSLTRSFGSNKRFPQAELTPCANTEPKVIISEWPRKSQAIPAVVETTDDNGEAKSDPEEGEIMSDAEMETELPTEPIYFRKGPVTPEGECPYDQDTVSPVAFVNVEQSTGELEEPAVPSSSGMDVGLSVITSTSIDGVKHDYVNISKSSREYQYEHLEQVSIGVAQQEISADDVNDSEECALGGNYNADSEANVQHKSENGENILSSYAADDSSPPVDSTVEYCDADGEHEFASPQSMPYPLRTTDYTNDDSLSQGAVIEESNSTSGFQDAVIDSTTQYNVPVTATIDKSGLYSNSSNSSAEVPLARALDDSLSSSLPDAVTSNVQLGECEFRSIDRDVTDSNYGNDAASVDDIAERVLLISSPSTTGQTSRAHSPLPDVDNSEYASRNNLSLGFREQVPIEQVHEDSPITLAANLDQDLNVLDDDSCVSKTDSLPTLVDGDDN